MTNEEAIKRLKEVQAEFNGNWIDYGGINQAFEKAYQALDERLHGEWIEGGKDVTGQYFYDGFICNKCSVVVDNKSNFCPRCGADMRGAESHLDNTQTVTINKDFYKREDLKKAVYTEFGNSNLADAFNKIIDNAPTVDIKDQIAGAYNEGWMCGNKEAEKARPQGEWIPVSERLPEEGVNVLLCIKDWKSQKTKMVVSLRQDYNYWDGLGRDIEGDIAWMSLPEAWKGEQNG